MSHKTLTTDLVIKHCLRVFHRNSAPANVCGKTNLARHFKFMIVARL